MKLIPEVIALREAVEKGRRITAQRVFATVARHLFAQGKATKDNNDACRYRWRGQACAVGCLIPDSLYRIQMEGAAVNSLLGGDDYVFIFRGKARSGREAFPGLKSLWPHEQLLERLQSVHDRNDAAWSSTDGMRKALREVGEHFGLKTDFLDKLAFADGR